MSDFKLLGICGSLRAASHNRQLVREAGRLMPGAEFTEGDLNLPLYNGDLEDAEGIPARVQELSDQIAAADAVVIATPEYNSSFSGVLKNALDWVSRAEYAVWQGKPVAIVSAAARRAGGARAQFALRLAMTPFRPNLLTGPEVLVAKAGEAFDENGQLTSPFYLRNLTELMANLKDQA